MTDSPLPQYLLARAKSTGRYYMMTKAYQYGTGPHYRRGLPTLRRSLTIAIAARLIKTDYDILFQSSVREEVHRKYMESPEGLSKAL